MRKQGWTRLSGLMTVVAALGACATEAPLNGAPTRVSPTAESHLRRRFPAQAARVLEARGFVPEGPRFVLDHPEAARWSLAASTLRAELPSIGDRALRLVVGDFEVRVREVSAVGEGALLGHAVAYRRAGGTAFWTAAPAGVEEWLHLEASQSPSGEAVATWDVEGASLRESGEGVDLLDAAGAARIRVTAPAAYAAGGRTVGATLHVRAGKIELTVDASGEEVLVDPLWSVTGTMNEGRQQHTATLLNGGRVLVTGGLGSSTLASAERYDPSSKTWATAATMKAARSYHTATRLSSGGVLVTGGAASTSLASAEVYSPLNNLWTTTAAMSVARESHTATLLSNGQVLIAGGYGGSYLASAEAYTPASDTWAPAGAMLTARRFHTATLLGNGQVLVTGGYGPSSALLASAELYDPATNAWAATAAMSAGRVFHTATLLGNGQVLVTGGASPPPSVMASAELYDPATQTWALTGTMSAARSNHTATLLGNGQVLVAGGSSSSVLATAELYNPSSQDWTFAGKLSAARDLHTATLLGDGEVLVAGGSSGASPLASAELFLRFNGAPCASLGDCQSGFCVDQVCCDTACNAGACDACSKAVGAAVDGTCALLTGLACDDNDACTEADTCQAGQCVGAPISCTTASSASSSGSAGGAGGAGGMGGSASASVTGGAAQTSSSVATGVGGGPPVTTPPANFYACSTTAPGLPTGAPLALLPLAGLALFTSRRRRASARAGRSSRFEATS